MRTPLSESAVKPSIFPVTGMLRTRAPVEGSYPATVLRVGPPDTPGVPSGLIPFWKAVQINSLPLSSPLTAILVISSGPLDPVGGAGTKEVPGRESFLQTELLDGWETAAALGNIKNQSRKK
jgi:hypothetical protein